MSKTDLALEAGATFASLIGCEPIAQVMTATKLTKGAIRQAFPNADDHVAEFIKAEIEAAVFTTLPEINKRVKQIEEQLRDTPSPTQAALIWTAFVEGFAHAEGQKRKLLLNALVNAFDAELYEQSMSARLLRMLDDLDYPDLAFLIELAAKRGTPNPWRQYEDLAYYHATQLVTHGLAHRHRTQGGVESTDDLAVVSGLGQWMVKLIRNPNTAKL